MSKGELPFHLALKHSSASDIMKLWNLYPEAASIVDRTTGLYPYQLAVIRGGGHQSYGNNNKSVRNLRVQNAHHQKQRCRSFFYVNALAF
jgi:hypothetical protein